MERGYVRSFFPAAERRFGFIRQEDGRECFFHAGGYRPLEVREDGSIAFLEEGYTERAPSPGDEIVFTPTQGGKGTKAYPWTYAEEHQAATAAAKVIIAASRVAYRLVERYDLAGQTGEDKVTFEGTLKELERRFPRPADHRADELRTGFGGSDFSHYAHFEKRDGDVWNACEDPRTRLDDRAYRQAMHTRVR